MLLKDLNYFGGVGIEKYCSLVYAELSNFCRDRGLPLHMIHLNKSLLGVEVLSNFPQGCPGIKCWAGLRVVFRFCILNRSSMLRQPRKWFKGNDTTILVKFMEYKYGRVLADDQSTDGLLECVWEALQAASCFLRILYGCGLWIPEDQAIEASSFARKFLSAYSKAATLCWHRNLPRFKIQPKFHMFSHVAESLAEHAAAHHVAYNPIIITHANLMKILLAALLLSPAHNMPGL